MTDHEHAGAKQAAAEMAAECLAKRSRFIGRTITAVFDDALRPVGITAAQVTILASLTHGGPTAQGELARLLHIEKSTMSRNVDRMRSRGWIAAGQAEEGRSHVLSVTEAGLQRLEAAEPLWRTAQRETLDMLGEDGARAIALAADRIGRRGR